MMDSVFEDGASSDFAPVVKAVRVLILAHAVNNV